MSDLVVVTLPSEEKAEEAARSCLRCNENTFAVSGNTSAIVGSEFGSIREQNTTNKLHSCLSNSSISN